ncbi:MAG: hypothetical protein LC107_02665 [Chitinophagales bacterium]|nr:hypothetical protein [Chitinophagales bacterium]
MEVKDFIDFLFRLGFSASKWKKELPLVRKEAEVLHSKLIPYDEEELTLLSLNKSNTSVKKGFTRLYKGILETIYFEPLFSYVIKEFGRDYKLTLVSSSTQEFIYLKKGVSRQVYLNEGLVGHLTENYKLLDDRRKLLGYIDYSPNAEQSPIWIADVHVGFVVNPHIKRATTTRAASLFKALNAKEQILYMSILLGFLTDAVKD